MTEVIKKNKISELVTKLIEFQEVSQNLDALVGEINEMREGMQNEEKKYNIKKYQYDKHQPILDKCKKEYDEIQTILKQIKERIEEKEDKKKKIKTIKEFKAINKEIDELNRKNAILENDLLTKTEEFDFKKEKIAVIEENIKELEELIKNKKENLESLLQERKKKISEYTEEKKKIEEKIPAKLVIVFNRIYKHKNKKAIVLVENQTCCGCYMRVPFQVEVHVKQQKDVVYCTNCSRILYYEKTPV